MEKHMKSFLFFLIVWTTTTVYAQDAMVSAADEPVKLAGGNGEFYMAPKYSPDGSRIAFTSAQYRGLYVLDIAGNSIGQVTDEMGAGFGFLWSGDSGSLVGRVSKYEGPGRLSAVKIFDLDDGQEHIVVDYRRNLSGVPQWSETGDAVVMYSRGRMEIFNTTIHSRDRGDDTVIQDDIPHVVAGTVPAMDIETLDPFPGETYLSAVTSPTNNRIVFGVMGGNMYVVNTDGSELTDLGRGFRPQWSPGGDYIVYMISEDDGHNYTASDIYAVRYDGTGHVRLTDDANRLFMNPSWSPDGSWIVFNDMNDGAIYILEIAK